LSPRFGTLPAMTSQPGPRLNAAFYVDSVAAFFRASDDEVCAPLARPHGYTLARERRRKAIVFVTGVPGAGKTLVGLNVATRYDEGQVTHLAAI